MIRTVEETCHPPKKVNKRLITLLFKACEKETIDN